MASVVYRCLSFVANDVIFFSDDVQTTTIAVAIASSLCCSIVWAVFHIISVVQPSKGTAKAKSSAIYTGKILTNRKNSQTVNTDDSVTLNGDDVEVPCVRCGNFFADANCRFVTCKQCCFAITACSFHQQGKGIKCRPYICHGHQPLQEIDLSGQQIQQCPERIGFVGAQLTLLNLAQNHLAELPEEIGCLRGLTDLYIDHNNISVLPNTLGSLVNLQSLNISFNQIQTLPDTLHSLQNLKVLTAGHNDIRDVPKCIGQLHNLVSLYLEYNKLTDFTTNCSSLKCLEVLVLHNNPLSSLSDEIRALIRLRELDVSSCDLHTIPVGICFCPNLTHLNLSHNKLTVLPIELGLLHSLQTLQLENNNLHYLPSTVDVDKYQNITVSENPFLKDDVVNVHVPSQMFPSLLETTFRYIISHGSYKTEILPQNLQDMLKMKKTCTRCGHLFISYYKSTIELRQTVKGNIPFYSQICSPHHLQHCYSK